MSLWNQRSPARVVPSSCARVLVSPLVDGQQLGWVNWVNIHRVPLWSALVVSILPNAHFHDPRHTGGTLAATTGATPKELMTRLGHSSTRAAMIYQHATRDRDTAIAQALGTLADNARNGS